MTYFLKILRNRIKSHANHIKLVVKVEVSLKVLDLVWQFLNFDQHIEKQLVLLRKLLNNSAVIF